MGSPCTLLTEASSTVAASTLTTLVADEVWRIEDKFSRYREGNVIDRINSAGGSLVRVDPECEQLLEFAETMYVLSGGLFDITSGVLREVWTFDGGRNIPDPQSVQEILPRVGWDMIEWQPPAIRLAAGMQVDFGGIGKEYAVDRAIALLHDSAAAPCLVNLGGDLAVTGPPTCRAAWSVGIDAIGSGTAETVVELRHGSLATSGNARRYLERDGVRYGHLLNPLTGWPVENAPGSVTVAADTCVQAGMLSTLAMLKGRDAEQFLADQDVQYWCRR